MTEPNKRFSPLLLLGDGLLLLCAVVGLAVSFLSLYSGAPAPLSYYTAHGSSALSGWAALFALLSLGAWSLPRSRLLAAGGLAAVWAGTALWNWETWWQGAKLTFSAISTQFAQRVNWGAACTFESKLNAAQRLAAVEFFLILTLALLALAVGWAIVRGRCWWMAVLFTLPPLLPGLLADLYPSWPAFMALCACWCAMLLADLCQDAAPASRGRLNLVTLPAVALVLAGLTLALPMEGYSRPAWTYQAEETLTDWSSRLSRFFEEFDGPFHTTITYVGSAETVNLRGAGPLNYSGRTVLRVKSDHTGHIYLRGTSLAVYDGGSWTALPDGVYQEYLDTLEKNALTPSPLIFPALKNTAGQTCTATVDNVGAVGSCVYTPYQLTGQDWAAAGMMPVEDAFVARLRGQWSHTVAFMPLSDALRPSSGDLAADGEDGGEVLFASGTWGAINAAKISLQERAYADYVRAHYLDVPEKLLPFLKQFIQEHQLTQFYFLTQGYLSSSSHFDPDEFLSHPYDASFRYVTISYAAQVADTLDGLCEYDPNTPLTPDGEDFVEYFLTESHRGYCMHFASSATLILRAMGIPARYVSGFTADTVAGRQVDVPDRAAHAWVEIYLDGYGWYPVEVTPDYSLEAPAPGREDDPPDPSLPPSLAPEESEPPVPSETPRPSQVPQTGPAGPGPNGGGQTAGKGVGPAFLRWPALLLGLAALLWLGQYLPKRLRRRRQFGPDTNRAALYSYRYLLRLKRWGGDVDDEALELAGKARFSQHILTAEERQTMADKVDEQRLRLCWRLHPVQSIVFRYLWGKPKR